MSPAGFDKTFNPIPELQQAGFTPTSGYRTPRHQASLVAQGLTKTRGGSHPRGDGIDFDVPSGMSKSKAIEIFKQKYPGAKVIPSNGNSIHATFPGWGGAPDVSNSRKRFK